MVIKASQVISSNIVISKYLVKKDPAFPPPRGKTHFHQKRSEDRWKDGALRGCAAWLHRGFHPPKWRTRWSAVIGQRDPTGWRSAVGASCQVSLYWRPSPAPLPVVSPLPTVLPESVRVNPVTRPPSVRSSVPAARVNGNFSRPCHQSRHCVLD